MRFYLGKKEAGYRRDKGWVGGCQLCVSNLCIETVATRRVTTLFSVYCMENARHIYLLLFILHYVFNTHRVRRTQGLGICHYCVIL